MPPLRWLIFLVFIPGFCPGLFGVPDPDHILFVSNIVAAASYAVLQGALKQPIEKTLWVWLLLIIFVMGYYVKFWIFVLTFEDFPKWHYEMPWLTVEKLTEAIAWTTVGFCIFCLETRLLLNIYSPSLEGRRMPPKGTRLHPSRFQFLLGAMLAAYVFTALVPLLVGFGQMAVEANVLPFRVDALITRTRVNLIPALFLLLLWLNDDRRQFARWSLILLLLITTVFGDSMVRASRSGSVMAAVPVILLWLLSHRMTFWRKQAILALLGVTIITYPFLTALRAERIYGRGLTSEVIQENSAKLFWNELDCNPVVYLYLVGARLSGLDGLLHILHCRSTPSFIEPERLLWMLDYNKMLGYQTFEVVEVPRQLIEGRVPGLLGAFVLVGGKSGMIVLLVLFIWISWAIWRMLLRSSIAPVALALFGTFYFTHTSESVHGVQVPIAWAVSIWLTHQAHKWLVGHASRTTQRFPAPTIRRQIRRPRVAAWNGNAMICPGIAESHFTEQLPKQGEKNRGIYPTM